MTNEQQDQFRKDFASIVYLKSQIITTDKHLHSLHIWDKNGSHQNAIDKALVIRKKQKVQLNELLKGKDYEEWKLFSKQLSILSTRLKRISIQKETTEKALDQLKF